MCLTVINLDKDSVSILENIKSNLLFFFKKKWEELLRIPSFSFFLSFFFFFFFCQKMAVSCCTFEKVHVVSFEQLGSDVFCDIDVATDVNPIALRMAKTLWSFGCSEYNMVKKRKEGRYRVPVRI